MNGLEWGRGELWPWLLALPAVWALLWLLLDRGRVAFARYGAAPTTPVARPLWRALRLTLLLGLGFGCWLDPRLGDEVVAVERRGLDVVFCLDTSRSMLARDMLPSRLERARRDIVSVLPELEGGDRVGLVVFAGEARLWIPLTHDVASFEGLLDEVDTEVVKTGGTDLGKALRKALEVVDLDNAATTVVVLSTDGEDLAGVGQQAATELKDKGLIVYAVGYGSALGSKITVADGDREQFLKDRAGDEVVSRMDPESLRQLAAVTGGEFLRADATALPLVDLHRKRLLPMQKRAYDAGEEKDKQARYQWLLLPLVLMLLLEIAFAGGRHR
ncbi:MAG: VWA domain-containing protein [Planctomycetes bacterium]|nr:VWA domain-containing protein [Planctomycetota bacterium]